MLRQIRTDNPMNTLNSPITNIRSEWISCDGPEKDVVLSTRARLARNVAGFAFPTRAKSADLEAVAAKIIEASDSLRRIYPDLITINTSSLTEEERSYLVDAHLASPQQVKPKDGRILLLESNGRIAIMVNEEDHLRIQAILPGLQTVKAWQLVDEIDDCLAEKLEFSASEKLGFLTASLTNLGTGLRISAMMHLGGLAMTGRLVRTIKAAVELDISVRGLFGEGSRGLGDFYQVSNEVTLGAPEMEFAERVGAVADYLVAEERNARNDLLEAGALRVIRAAQKSIKLIREAEKLNAKDALSLLSPLRVAVCGGLVDGIKLSDLNELMITLGIMRLETPNERELEQSDRRRAVMLRRAIRNVIV